MARGKQYVPDGGRVRLAFPGGGGYGDPAERDPKLVERDLRLGYLSHHAAEAEYGIVNKNK